MKTVFKLLAALATVAGAIYLIATYGEQIVAWCRKVMSMLPQRDCGCTCDCHCDCECDCENCDCEDSCDDCKCDCSCDTATAEETPVEESAEAASAEEVPVVEIPSDAVVASEEDFEG